MTRSRLVRSHRHGFTLVELLVVIAIITALIGLLLPAVQKVREAANRAQCLNNLKQMALGLHNYHDAYQVFPPGQGSPPGDSYFGYWSGPTVNSTFIAVLPFIEQGNLYDAVNGSGGSRSTVSPVAQPIKTLTCPSDTLPNPPVYTASRRRNYAMTSYGVNAGTQPPVTSPTPLVKDGIFNWNTDVRLTDITDGASSTILLGERSHFEPLWGTFYPQLLTVLSPSSPSMILGTAWSASDLSTCLRSIERINYRLPPSVASSPPPEFGPAWNDMYYKRLSVYGSQHPGGCNLAFADGSIRFVSDSIDLITLNDLNTRAGGEVIASDY
jgi:prepilin-type N-terminal cleavage/methylation domain-containing protein/prepilin-type processing-associated H-X9-DG protein